MSEWKKTKLSECCLSISDGDHQPPPKAESGVPFVTIANMTATNQFDFSETLFVPQDYYDELDDKRKAKKDDILYSVVGSFGIPVFMREDRELAFQRHIAILRPDRKQIEPRFLFYTMLTREFYAQSDAVAIGAAQRTISLSALRNMEISIPTKQEQEKIVQILSSYDDLIENSQMQVKHLEESAQRLYKEWFVDMRFPGHENAQYNDSLPEGWKKGMAEDFFDITIGKTPPRAEKQWFVNGGDGIPWVSISDMGSAGTFIFKTSEDLTRDAIERHNIKIVPAGTILVSFKLTLGRTSIANEEMCTNEAIAHFRIDNSVLREYTYSYLKEFEYDTLGNTSSISKAVNSKIIKRMPFIMPEIGILEKYSKIVSPIFDLIHDKQSTIIILTEARDRLLPKLMSGEIEL